MGGKGIVAFFMLIILAAYAHALALSYEPLENNTLALAPGQNYYFKLIIQNEENEDIAINVSLVSSIATLTGDPLLTIPGKTYDRFIYFNITVPQDAIPGEGFDVNYSVTPTRKGEGQVPFTIAYERGFAIIVTQKPGVLVAAQPPEDIDGVERHRESAIIFLLIAVLSVAIITVVALVWMRSAKVAKRLRKLENVHAARVPEDKAFFAHNGAVFRDTHELLQGLKQMRDEDFHHHVTPHKNDISKWADEALQLHDLSARLQRAHTRNKMIKVLEDEHR